jgi:hypothetical protein
MKTKACFFPWAGFIGCARQSRRKPKFSDKSILFMALLFPGLLFAQNSGSGDEVFAPFITRFSAEVKNNLVRLSWADSPNARGPVFIYRSFRPFGEAQPISSIKPVEVSYGTGFYIDEPETGGRIYYYAAASDESGRQYDIFIPNGNSLSVVLDSAFTAAPPPERAVSGGPGITGLSARLEGDGVLIDFRAPAASRSVVLYRSVQPVRQTQDLLGAVIVRPGVTPPFMDHPTPGIAYYYAAVFEDELNRGTVAINPGGNATTAAVTVAAGPPSRIRSAPLPRLSVTNAVPGTDVFSELKEPLPLQPGTAKALMDLKSPAQASPPKKPRAFRRDLETPAGGDDSALMSIVQGPFMKRDWETAREELGRFLSLPRAAETEARARFYLGQAHYYSGGFREALAEFLALQSLFPDEAREWIDAVLARMIH